MSRPVSGLRYLVLALVGLLLIACPVVLAWLADLGALNLPGDPVVVLTGPIMIVGGLTIAIHVFIVSMRAVFGHLPWISHRHSFVAGFVITLLAVGWWVWMFVYTMIEAILT